MRLPHESHSPNTMSAQIDNKASEVMVEAEVTTGPPPHEKNVAVQKSRRQEQTDDTKETRIEHTTGELELDHKSKILEDSKASKPTQTTSFPGLGAISTTNKSQLRSNLVASNRPKQAVNEEDLNYVLLDACATAEKLKESQEECAKLRAQTLKLRRDLKEAQDFVFSLQPRQTPFTESEAALDFRSLCDSVQIWVERELSDFIFEKVLFKNRTQVATARKLLAHISLPGKEASKIPGTDDYNITTVIMRFLEVNVFNKDFYCGVGEREVEFLRSLQASMRSLNPPRDVSTLRCWRSETYTALANRPEFKAQRLRQSAFLADELATMLSIFVPRGGRASQAFSMSIEKSIIEPAFSLAHQFQLSVNKFSLQWTRLGEKRPEYRSHDLKDYNQFECVDFFNFGKIIKPQHAALIKEVTYIFDLTPALLLEVAKADSFAEPKVVNKGRVLIGARKKQEGTFMLPSIEEGESPTLVCWLKDKLDGKP